VVSTVVNVLVIVVAVWGRQSIGGALDRYVVKFAKQPADLALIEPVREIAEPLLQILIVTSIMNLAVTLWLYRISKKQLLTR